MLLVAVTAACGRPSEPAPAPARQALEPFKDNGYACAGPSSDNSQFGQWHCDRTSPDGVSTFIVIDADDSGVKQVTATVDQSKRGTPDPGRVTEFFSKVCEIQVADMPPDAKAWVLSHVPAGGQEHLGPMFITLEPLEAVTHLVLFASGSHSSQGPPGAG